MILSFVLVPPKCSSLSCTSTQRENVSPPPWTDGILLRSRNLLCSSNFLWSLHDQKNKTNKIPWWHLENDSLFYHLFGAVGRKVAWGCGAWGLIRIRRLPWGRTQLRRPLYDATSIHLQRSGKKSGKHKTLADQSPLPDYGNGTHAACDVGIHRNMIYKSSSRFPCYTFTKTLLYIYIYTIPANSSTTKMYNSKDKNVYTVHTYI